MEDDVFVRADHEGNITGFAILNATKIMKKIRGKAPIESNLFPNAAINIIIF